MRLLLVLLFGGVLVLAQSVGHTVTLTWTDTQNPSGTTYNVYRATADCSTNPALVKITTAPVTEKTWVDSNVQPGRYCYAVRAELNGEESADSNRASARVQPWAAEALTVVVK